MKTSWTYDDITAAVTDLMNSYIDAAKKERNDECRFVWIYHAWGAYALWHQLAIGSTKQGRAKQANAKQAADREKLKSLFMK